MKRRLLTVLLAGVLAAAVRIREEIPVLIPVQAPGILVLSQ